MRAVRRRQVFDLATPPPPQVIEYAADVKCCPGCGKRAMGAFPDGVESAAQYGPGITTKVADAAGSCSLGLDADRPGGLGDVVGSEGFQRPDGEVAEGKT